MKEVISMNVLVGVLAVLDVIYLMYVLKNILEETENVDDRR